MLLDKESIEFSLKDSIRRAVDGVNTWDSSHVLGFVRMPVGYALMSTDSHYYWLRHDGEESVVHVSKWHVYHSSKFDYAGWSRYVCEDEK